MTAESALYACPGAISQTGVPGLKEELGRRGEIPIGAGLNRRQALGGRHIPVDHLVTCVWLDEYNIPASWSEVEFSPRQVAIPLKQHVGVPAEPLVKAGHRVEAGQVIAVPPPDKLGAAVHASIPGRVTEVTKTEIVIVGE